MGVGLVILVFLVVTTPGWQEVLGVNVGTLNTGRYMPALLLLGFMAALVAFVLLGKKES